MKIILRILRILILILLVLVLAVNLWLVAGRLILKQDLPKLGGFSQAVVMSGSMEPSFSAGDMLVFRERDSYQIGEIVIFRQGSVFVTHRLVGEQDGNFITKGDANNTEDQELLDPANIEGELILIVPHIGQLLGFLKTPLGLLVLLVVGFALLEVPSLIDRRRGKRVKRDAGKN